MSGAHEIMLHAYCEMTPVELFAITENVIAVGVSRSTREGKNAA